jgi:hypothetical protein
MNTNNLIKFNALFINLLTQQPKGQISSKKRREKRNILSRALVTIDGVWIGNWIY